VDTLLPLLQLLGLAYCFALPGWLIAIQLDEAWSRVVRLAVGLALGLLIVPTVCFVAAWLLRTSIQPLLVVGVATGLNAAALAVYAIRRPSAGERMETGEPPEVP
jgi:hypothetical protein